MSPNLASANIIIVDGQLVFGDVERGSNRKFKEALLSSIRALGK